MLCVSSALWFLSGYLVARLCARDKFVVSHAKPYRVFDMVRGGRELGLLPAVSLSSIGLPDMRRGRVKSFGRNSSAVRIWTNRSPRCILDSRNELPMRYA